MTVAIAVQSVRQGFRNLMFMSVVVMGVSKPVMDMTAAHATVSAKVIKMPPCKDSKTPSNAEE
jgi:hypothetical protein